MERDGVGWVDEVGYHLQVGFVAVGSSDVEYGRAVEIDGAGCECDSQVGVCDDGADLGLGDAVFEGAGKDLDPHAESVLHI